MSTASAEPIFVAEDISVRFGGLQAVSGVSLEVRPGTVTAIIGPNGAGKSTFLNAVTGFLPRSTGRVTFRGQRLDGVPPWRRVTAGIARTFQDLEVFPKLTVAENVAVGLPTGFLRRHAPQGTSRLRERERLPVVRELLERVGLTRLADRRAAELSYGEQKLLVVARLMATQAELLIFDEPAAGLAHGSIAELGTLLRELAGQGRTVLLVDHNMGLIFDYADYVYVLHHGELLAHGLPADIKANQAVMDVYLGGDLAGDEA